MSAGYGVARPMDARMLIRLVAMLITWLLKKTNYCHDCLFRKAFRQ